MALVVPFARVRQRLIQGWVTVIREATNTGRNLTNHPMRLTRIPGARPAGGTSDDPRTLCPAVAQPLKVWQRLERDTRTDNSAPHRTGLFADRLADRTRRCHEFAGKGIVVWEPSVGVSTPEPKILSAIKTNPRNFPPGTILDGERSFPASTLSLRSARTRPPQLGNQPLFRGTLRASSGGDGVDSKTGAAIQRPALPGEPR